MLYTRRELIFYPISLLWHRKQFCEREEKSKHLSSYRINHHFPLFTTKKSYFLYRSTFFLAGVMEKTFLLRIWFWITCWNNIWHGSHSRVSGWKTVFLHKTFSTFFLSIKRSLRFSLLRVKCSARCLHGSLNINRINIIIFSQVCYF